MKFEILNKTFTQKLKALNGFSKPKDIGAYIKIKSESSEQISLTVSNHINYCSVKMFANVIDDGEILMNYKELVKIVSSANDVASLCFEKSNGKIRIYSVEKEDEQMFDFTTIAINVEVKQVTDFKKSTSFLYSGAKFSNLLNVAIPFANKSDYGRQHLMGVRMELIGGGISFKATNGKKICSTFPSFDENEIEGFEPITIPLDFATEVIKAYDKTKDGVSVTVSKNYINIYHDEITMGSALLSQQFPNIDRAIPKDLDSHFTVGITSLAKALRKTSVCCDLNKKIEFKVCSNALEVIADDGERRVSVDLDCYYNGDETSLYFNCDYIKDIISVYNSSNMSFYLTKDKNKILLEDNNATFVVAGISPK